VKNNKTKPSALAIACGSLLMVSLAGCGGGGDDAGASGFAAEPAQKYVGTWVEPCDDSTVARESAPLVFLKQKVRITYTKVSASKLSFVTVSDIYPTTDCSGTPLVSQTNNAAGNSLTVDGTKTVNGQVVDKITVVLSNVGGLSGGAGIVINGLVYPGDYFTAIGTFKDIALVNGNQFITSELNAPQDVQGYPDRLGGAADTATKL
jgi:hypothetical protein